MTFQIGKREVGGGRCFIIGEVGLAHDGSLQAAHAYVDAIYQAGADAVKFQCHLARYEPDAEMRVKHPQYLTRREQWLRTSFNFSEWSSLKNHANAAGMEFLCSPFSVEAVKFLDDLVPAWKVPSGEVTNGLLLEAIAQTGKPVLLSTGMSTNAEWLHAWQTLYVKNMATIVMQCTSLYPCPPEKIGLNDVKIARQYGDKNGLSDHSGTIYAGLAAVTLGCDVLEVHVKLSEWDQGPDASSSLTPEKLKELVEGVRWIERAKASPVDKDALAKELEPMRKLFMREPAHVSD